MSSIHPQLKSQRDQLRSWLVNKAYPLWANHGIDAQGGCIELLDQQARPLSNTRRARIQPRQVYSYAMAKQFGWQGNAELIVRTCSNYFIKHYQRDDSLFRTLCNSDGSIKDDRVVLYDQSFALLGFASAASALSAVPEFEARALQLRGAIEKQLRTHALGFLSDTERKQPRQSNPHMHLLEACLAWAEISHDADWNNLAEEIADLAMTKYIQPSGALFEFFDDDWNPAPDAATHNVEPGHQFEWAWLLLRCDRKDAQQRRAAALRLIDIGEQYGVKNEVAINSLATDFSVHDAKARMWPQTERLKAGVLAAIITGDDRYWSIASSAAEGLLRYLNTPIPGLWLDTQLPDGSLLDEPASASSFYHIVAAIKQLEAALA
jgi:mannose/cellobiose epimerase-like protein (N-acyl-D-glucosamine 2-epimerase family)